MDEESNTPYVGQIVDFHPDEMTRYAAIVIEVYQTEDDLRPLVDLNIFLPEGKLQYCKKVKPTSPSETDEDVQDLAGRWSFQQEIALSNEDDSDDSDKPRLGTQSNLHVGTISDRF